MKSKKIIILLIILVGIVTGLYWYVTTTPEYSLNQIKNSIENHDVPLFQKHVDVKTISSRLIDDVMTAVLDETDYENEWEELGGSLGLGLIQMMKPRLIDIVEEQMIRFVEKGSIDESTSDELGVLGNGNDLNNVLENGKDSFKGIDYIRKEGSTAYIGISIEDKTNDWNGTIELLMRNMGGYWQVSEISNASEILEDFEI